MTLRSSAARAFTALIGSPPVTTVARRRWAPRLRVIDFHDVTDPAAFDAQMALLARSYRPVGEDDVRAAIAGGPALPDLSVWVTFDDGDPSVIRSAMPSLLRHGIPATFYVCPGLIEASEPPWWEVIAAAGRTGHGAEVEGRLLLGWELVFALKARPDVERRAALDLLRPEGLAALADEWRPFALADLDRWVDAGFGLGNHSWDHPCLDQCTEAEQAEQIVRAHEWLRSYRPDRMPSFAYPNGDHTAHAESVLAELGYPLALLADHRLADVAGNPLRLSRLRLDTADGLRRTQSVLTGAHSAAYAVALRTGLASRQTQDR